MANKKKSAEKKNSTSRLEEFLLIAKIHETEASAAKDRQQAMKINQELFGAGKS